MPCLTPLIDDLAPLIVQGDAMRDALVAVAPLPLASAYAVLTSGEPMNGSALLPASTYAPMHADMAWGGGVEVLFDPMANPVLGNSVIACPDGSALNVLDGDMPLTGAQFLQTTTVRWLLTVQTQSSDASALANVRVVVLDIGQLAVTGMPVVAEALSDGSGNVVIGVPQNTAYLVVAYKSGTVDVAGTSAQTLSPDPA